MTHPPLPDIADPAIPLRWLAACPVHAATPLRNLEALAAELGWSALLAKDESKRMGLGSFKALGGAYAVLDLVAGRIGRTLGRAAEPADILMGDPGLASQTVCCASAGNHGLSVAAGARVFGVACEVFLADNVPEAFALRLLAAGATVVRAGRVYEEAMAAAVTRAADPDVTLVSDTAWAGEMRVPSMVMQGYAVMGQELHDACAAWNDWPTHVALQAGVGGMAAAIAAHVRRTWPSQPEITVVEPEAAACLARSVAAGSPVRADGPVSTMGRLDCKEPSLRALEVLRDMADRFDTVSDGEAETACDLLTANGIATTPSGAAGLAGMIAHAPGPEARVLVIVTEGTV